jgi:putative membrane protein
VGPALEANSAGDLGARFARPARAAAPRLLTLLCAAAAVLTIVFSEQVFASLSLPPLTRHMAGHILLMNLLGPVLALCLLEHARSDQTRGLLLPTAVQLTALWLWHMPAALAWAHGSAAADLLMKVTLFAAALWFWLAVFRQSGAARWRAILVLLITGKLFCMLGALLIFAPRLLYSRPFMHDMAAHLPAALEDQHLAGLLVITACPASYVLAGIVIAARWLGEIERQT